MYVLHVCSGSANVRDHLQFVDFPPLLNGNRVVTSGLLPTHQILSDKCFTLKGKKAAKWEQLVDLSKNISTFRTNTRREYV